MIAEDVPVAVLFANYRTPRAFPGEERSIIELFAVQAAIAIQNARRAEANHAAAANKEAARDARDTSYFTLYENDDALIAARPAEITSLLKQGFTQTQVASLMRKKEKLANEAEEVSVSKRAVDGAFIKAGIGNKTARVKPRSIGVPPAAQGICMKIDYAM